MWLDELSGYGKLRQGPTVQDLPRQLREIGSPVVVVATCRLGEDEEAARANVGKLLRRLTPVYPADISREEGEALVKMLAKVGVKGDSEEFDGTPGSVLLGVCTAHMRDDIYPRLWVRHRRVAMVLHTMKLLQGAGIRTYPEERVARQRRRWVEVRVGRGCRTRAAGASAGAGFHARAN